MGCGGAKNKDIIDPRETDKSDVEIQTLLGDKEKLAGEVRKSVQDVVAGAKALFGGRYQDFKLFLEGRELDTSGLAQVPESKTLRLTIVPRPVYDRSPIAED